MQKITEWMLENAQGVEIWLVYIVTAAVLLILAPAMVVMFVSMWRWMKRTWRDK